MHRGVIALHANVDVIAITDVDAISDDIAIAVYALTNRLQSRSLGRSVLSCVNGDIDAESNLSSLNAEEMSTK